MPVGGFTNPRNLIPTIEPFPRANLMKIRGGHFQRSHFRIRVGNVFENESRRDTSSKYDSFDSAPDQE